MPRRPPRRCATGGPATPSIASPILSAIRVPALVVGGTADVLTPPKYQRYLAEQLPRAQLELVEGAGHMLPFEVPHELARRVRAWAGGVA